jgi:hypothetical protein
MDPDPGLIKKGGGMKKFYVLNNWMRPEIIPWSFEGL